MLVGKLINALDKAKAEVVVDVSIAEVNLDACASSAFHRAPAFPPTFARRQQPPPASSSTTAASAAVIALNMLKHLSTADYNITLPSATVTALLNTNNTNSCRTLNSARLMDKRPA